jgi:ketosteroid isomerase-like protein
MRAAFVVGLGLVTLTHSLVAQQKSTSVAATLERLEREYVSVSASTDSAVGRRLVERNAVMIDPDGRVMTGEEMLRIGWSGEVVVDSARMDSLQVRQLAPTVALVYGLAHIQARAKGGTGSQDLSGDYRLLNVWRRQNGHWRVAAEQSHRIHTP